MNDFLKIDQSPIYQAVALGDIAVLSELVDTGHDINTQVDAAEGWGIFYLGVTPLMVAACSPQGATVETLQWLIDHGADVTRQATGKTTAAWYAAGWGIFMDLPDNMIITDQVDRLRLLLRLGADPNETARNGRSLLIEACRTGHAARVDLLLASGAAANPIIEAVDPSYQHTWAEGCSCLSSYQIPLFNAVSAGSADCVRQLLAAGADVHLCTNGGETALMYARNPTVVNLLLAAGVDVSLHRKQGWDAFQQMVKQETETPQEDEDILRSLHILIDHGIGINVTQRGKNRLYDAAFDQNPWAIERLLQLGAIPTVDDPLLSAITWHYNDEFDPDIARAIDLLVSAGEDINGHDNAGDTLLHNATLEYAFPPNEANYFGSSDGCNYTAVTCLLNHGAHPDPVGTHGRTPLMLAATSASSATLQALLAAGANPHRQDHSGHTALDIARQTYATIAAQAEQSTTAKDQELRDTLGRQQQCIQLLSNAMANAAPPPQSPDPKSKYTSQ